MRRTGFHDLIVCFFISRFSFNLCLFFPFFTEVRVSLRFSNSVLHISCQTATTYTATTTTTKKKSAKKSGDSLSVAKAAFRDVLLRSYRGEKKSARGRWKTLTTHGETQTRTARRFHNRPPGVIVFLLLLMFSATPFSGSSVPYASAHLLSLCPFVRYVPVREN